VIILLEMTIMGNPRWPPSKTNFLYNLKTMSDRIMIDGSIPRFLTPGNPNLKSLMSLLVSK
jgi:hypothetical protein